LIRSPLIGLYTWLIRSPLPFVEPVRLRGSEAKAGVNQGRHHAIALRVALGDALVDEVVSTSLSG
jgi:hypothetical protein